MRDSWDPFRQKLHEYILQMTVSKENMNPHQIKIINYWSKNIQTNSKQ